jgi:hypothetical protein
LAWQVFALLMRWLATAALWWSLKLTWPKQAQFAFWVSLFALVYPGFSQHSIAIAYGHYSMMLAFFFASLGLSLLALRQGRARALVIGVALILSALQLFSTEYFFGLELLRPVLFWLVVGEIESDARQRIKRTTLAYLPYGLVLLAFGVWRGFIFESRLYEGASQSAALTSSLPRQVVDALWNSTFAAWTGVFHMPPTDETGTRLTTVYWIVLPAVFAVLAYVSNHLRGADSNPPGVRTEVHPPYPFLQWFAIGALAVLTAGIPFYVARLPVQLKFPDDRFTQPFAFGVAILLAAALELLPRVSWKTLAAGSLVTLAVGLQIQNAFSFREDWKLQKTYFWQLAWRVPALQSGTSILSERSPFAFTDDDALTAPTNWIYMPQPSGVIEYQQVSISTRLGFNVDTMKFGKPIEGKLLKGDFVVDASKLLVVQFSPPSCLRVLDPLYDSALPVAPRSREQTEMLLDAGLPFLRREEAAALPLSSVDQIVRTPDQPSRPMEAIFGAEPSHQWCYYFERADLARSFGDWTEVARLGDEAFSIPFRPNNLSEYLPFVEAFARTGRLVDAKKLTMDVSMQMPILRPALCALWQRVSVSGNLSEADAAFSNQIQSDLGVCPVQSENE